MLLQAKTALEKALELGDETAKKQMPWVEEMLKFEEYAVKALEKKAYREAMSYLRKLLESCVESVRHTCLYMEAMARNDPNDMTDCVSFSSKVQNKFV